MDEDKFEQFRLEVAEFRRATGISQNALARMSNYQGSVLSQVLSGSYKGNITDVMYAVRNVMEKERARYQNAVKKIPFFQTTIYEKILNGINFATTYSKIAVIIGDTGIGKSAAVKEYKKDNPNCILVEADDTYKVKTVLKDIAKQIGLTFERKSDDVLMAEIVERLKDSKREIIIDEAERLQKKCFAVLRRLRDKSGVPLVLIGQSYLVDDLIMKRKEMESVISRMHLVKLARLTQDDTEELVKFAFSEKATNEIVEAIHIKTKGITQYVCDLIGLISITLLKNPEKELSKAAIEIASQGLIILKD